MQSQRQQQRVSLLGYEATFGQQQIVGSVLDPKIKRLIISCMTRYGKTLFVAIGLLLVIANTPVTLKPKTQRILIIAPTRDQTNIIRNYIADRIADSAILRNLVNRPMRSGPENLKAEMSKKRLTFKNGWEIITLTAHGEEGQRDAGSQLMGHGGKIIVLDEACYVKNSVYTSRISRMLGDDPDSKLITIINPWDMGNFAYDQWKDPQFKRIHIDWRQALVEGRTTEAFLGEQRSNLSDYEWTVLYESMFAQESEDTLIRYDWIQRAVKEPVTFTEPMQTIWGLDVGEQGADKSILTRAATDCTKYRVEGQQWIREQETIPCADHVANLVPKTEILNVDSIGVGAGVYSSLKERGYCVNSIRVSERPTVEEDRYINLKSQRWWHLRLLFEHNLISIPNEKTLISQLSQMRYKFTTAGKIQIVDPQGKSPDHADSLMLTILSMQRRAKAGRQ